MVNYSNNQGQSIEDAIIISGAENGLDGVNAEYDYIAQKFGKEGETWQRGLQALIKSPDGKSYDRITFNLADGQEKMLYFDIPDFFGKE